MTFRHYLLVGILVVTLLVFLLPGPEGLSRKGKMGLAVLVCAGGLWVTEPIPLQVTGLVIPVMLVGTGILRAKAALAPFASPVVFLILGSLFLAEALRKHGLTRRIALDLIVRCRGRPRLLLLAMMGVAAFTSMWVFSTAVVAMLIPVCLGIATRVEERKRDRFITVLLMALVFASTLGALSTILGASSNAVASGVLTQVLHDPWTFLDWMKYGTPLALLYVVLTWGILVVFFYPDVDRIPTDVIQEELQETGPMTTAEKGILYILGAAILLWVSGPALEEYLAFPNDLMHSAIISLVAAAGLFVGNIITWQDARQVNWGIYLIIGAGLALGKGLHVSGVSTWFAHFLVDVVTGMPYILIAGIIILVSALASNTVNNTTVVALFAPVVADAATRLGLGPTELMLPMAFGATFGFILPSASSRMVLIYASGEVSHSDMLLIGSIITAPLIVLTIGYFYLLSGIGWL